MANLIDSSYFNGEILVPNITGSHPAQTVNVTELDRFIVLYERDYLIKLLGKTLYAEFIAQQTESWAVSLIGQLRDSTLKISPIAYYIWYWWKCHNTTQITAQGEAAANNENAGIVSPMHRLQNAYNSCVNLTYDVLEWMEANQSTFPSVPVPDFQAFRPINTLGI